MQNVHVPPFWAATKKYCFTRCFRIESHSIDRMAAVEVANVHLTECELLRWTFLCFGIFKIFYVGRLNFNRVRGLLCVILDVSVLVQWSHHIKVISKKKSLLCPYVYYVKYVTFSSIAPTKSGGSLFLKCEQTNNTFYYRDANPEFKSLCIRFINWYACSQNDESGMWLAIFPK